MYTRENYTLAKNDQIEQQLLMYLSEYYDKYNILDNESEDLEFEISYYLIEKDLITVNLNFYFNDETQNDAVWIYKKQVKIETKELLERIDILTSYE